LAAPSLSPPHIPPIDNLEAPSDIESGTGEAGLWDPHAGMKPSPVDEWESDANNKIEDALPYGASLAVQSSMVDMMVGLGNDDTCDIDWLPLRERKKLEARKKGMMSHFNV